MRLLLNYCNFKNVGERYLHGDEIDEILALNAHIQISKEELKALDCARVNIESLPQINISPLHAAIILNHCPAIIQALLDTGANIEAQDYYNQTPLHAAISSNRSAIARALIDARANIEARDHDNYTPLHIATIYNPTVIQTLLDARANVETPSREYDLTPLDIARLKGNTEVIKLLEDALKTAADIKSVDEKTAITETKTRE